MFGRIDRINAELPKSNYHEDANSLLRSLSFEAKPHLTRGGLAGVEGMAAPSRKRETDCPAVLARHRPTPRPYPVKGAANLSLVRRIGKAGARVVQNSLVIDFPRAVIFKTRRSLADIVAKVENRSAPKIWRKLILGYLRGCVTFQRHWEGRWLILDETIWSPTSARAKCISGSENFRPSP
jgi:hypothetical protein